MSSSVAHRCAPPTGTTAAARRRPGPARRLVGGWSSRGTDGHALRADLEGVRALAVLGVVIYHLKSSWLPGGFAGVDVFFVLSGFFITGLLLREVQRTGTVDLLAFWGRRARRLLPAAALVLIGTIVAGMLFIDPVDARRFAQDGLWTALFSVNWHFAQQGTSYLSDTDPSPMTHFWSLGVEEQFYVVWPVLLAVVAWVVLRLGRRWMRGATAVLAAGLGVVSFVLAWKLTAGLQPYAYFATYSRVWQLGVGAALAALAIPLARLPIALRTVARWAGVAAIVGFYALAPLDIVYPGTIALVPTLAAGLIIVAGLPRADGRAVAGRLDPVQRALSSRPGRFFGRYSYGWYLWHWPPLVLLPIALHHALTPWQLVLTAAVTLGCAVASYHLLEHPVRSSAVLARRRGRLSLVLGAVIVLAGVSTAQAVGRHTDTVVKNVHVTTASGTALTPSPAVALAEHNQAEDKGCELGQTVKENAPECRYLADQGKGDVVLIGDSHAAQWLPAVLGAAKSKDWGLRVWTRANCPFADVTKIINGSPNGACDDWRTNAVQRLVADKPSLVVVSSYPPPGGPTVYDRTTKKAVSSDDQAKQVYEAGMARELKVLADAHIPTLLIDDLPRFDQAAGTCVLENPDTLSACSAPQASAEHAPTDAAAAARVPSVKTLDLTDVFCHDDRCYQVIGHTIAYRDNNHLTHEMAARLTPQVLKAMVATVA